MGRRADGLMMRRVHRRLKAYKRLSKQRRDSGPEGRNWSRTQHVWTADGSPRWRDRCARGGTGLTLLQNMGAPNGARGAPNLVTRRRWDDDGSRSWTEAIYREGLKNVTAGRRKAIGLHTRYSQSVEAAAEQLATKLPRSRIRKGDAPVATVSANWDTDHYDEIIPIGPDKVGKDGTCETVVKEGQIH